MGELANISRALVVDGCDIEVVKGFASLGAGGKHPSSEERDMHTWLKKKQLQPYYLNVTLSHQNTLEDIDLRWPVLPMHELFHVIHLAGPEKFKTAMLGTASGSLEEFWARVQEEAWDTTHPVCSRPDRGSFVPINHHSDGAGVNKTTEM